MKSNLAYKLYENQLRIEEEQRAPFQKRPLIEPQIAPEVRARFLYSNPYYSDDPAMSDLDKAQKIRLLKSVNIDLPPGVDPDGLVANDYIKAHIRLISDTVQKPLTTLSDLVAFYQTPDQKQSQQLKDIIRSVKSLPDDLMKKWNEIKEDKEEDKWGIEESKEVESKLRTKRDDEVIPEAVTPVYFPRGALNGMVTEDLIAYGRNTLKMKPGRRGYSLSGNRKQIIESLMKRTAEFTNIKNVA